MNQRVITILATIFLIGCQSNYRPPSKPIIITEPIYETNPIQETYPEPVSPEPDFREVPQARQVDKNLGIVLGDIESHMPNANHIYKDNDKITWGHETTHGLNSHYRSKFRVSGKRINALYVLNNRVAVIEEPKTTIRAAAKLVPQALRGGVYNLYMIQQAGSWGDTPLYIFDEWVAYANGSAVRADLKIQRRGETVKYMLEFNVYALAVAKACKTEDRQFKDFLKWHLHRSMQLVKQNETSGGDISRAHSYWEKVQTDPAAESFRQFAREYLSQQWVKTVLGF